MTWTLFFQIIGLAVVITLCLCLLMIGWNDLTSKKK